MLHWAISFGAMALIAAGFALTGVGWPLSVALFWVFLALFVLALWTGLFGRGRDGLYSAERAVGLTTLAGALAALAFVWVSNSWTAEDAGRALDQGVTRLTTSIAGEHAGGPS